MSFVGRLAIIAFAGAMAIVWLTGLAAERVAEQFVASSTEATRSYNLASLRELMDGFVQIGLELNRMPTLQDIIERNKVLDPSVVSIDIVGRNGRIVYSTDPTAVGLDTPQSWSGTIVPSVGGDSAAHGQAVSQIRERDEIIMGSTVLDTIGQPLATVVMTATENGKARGELQSRISFVTMIAGVVAGSIAGLAALAIGRRLRREVDAATAVLPIDAAIEGSTGVFANAARQVRSAWDQADTRFAAAFRDLERLDDAL